ncbi:hypothetical protein O1L60_26360 [Streptomyces diastatochromogenes]|nr:hypothetical protein [Streptomyces diastatochromogenes]
MDGVVEGVGGDVAGAGVDRDDHAAGVGAGQVLVVGGEEGSPREVHGAGAGVLRVQSDVRAQFGRAVVQPADLPARPRGPDQFEGGRAMAEFGAGALPGEEEEHLAAEVEQYPALGHVVVQPPAVLAESGKHGENRRRPFQQVEVDPDGPAGPVQLVGAVLADHDDVGSVSHRVRMTAREAVGQPFSAVRAETGGRPRPRWSTAGGVFLRGPGGYLTLIAVQAAATALYWVLVLP